MGIKKRKSARRGQGRGEPRRPGRWSRPSGPAPARHPRHPWRRGRSRRRRSPGPRRGEGPGRCLL